jgi:amino acid permease
VPLRALSITLCFALVSLMTSFIAADTLFMVLMAVSGMSGTVTWIVIALAQYRFRQPTCVRAATQRPEIPGAAVPGGAAAVHHPVQFAVRVPGPG